MSFALLLRYHPGEPRKAGKRMYPPQQPHSGLYRAKLLSVFENDSAYEIRYDIAVGQSVGWATYMYQQTDRWPLIWRLDKRQGALAIRCALDAIDRDIDCKIKTMRDAIGYHLCLQLEKKSHGYIDVKKSFPAKVLEIHPDDIQIGTVGGWRQGDAN